jgi:predicted dehydrogenase
MQNSKTPSRRQFLAAAAGAAAAAWAGPLVLPSGVLARAGQPGANDRVALGYIGVGRRAGQLTGIPADAVVIAISDVNKPRMAEFAAGRDWKQFADYREMLQLPDLDGVIVASPDHWHALHTVHAFEAGKDVYCEKPISLTVAEGRAMADAAQKHGRVFQAGSQQRSMPETQAGIDLIRSGRIGKVRSVHGANYPSPWECDLPEQPVPDGLDWDFWLGPTEPRPYHTDIYTPRAKPGWISFRPWSGGEMTGWGAHGIDVIQWGLDAELSGPVRVWPVALPPGTFSPRPEGARVPREERLRWPVCFEYADGTVVHLDDGGPGGGAVFEGDEGRILVDRAYHQLLEPGQERPAKVQNGPDRTNEHIKNWVDCIRSREKPVADIELAHRSTTVCHLGNIARWTGRELRWDPTTERFLNDDEANALLSRPMRAPWTL